MHELIAYLSPRAYGCDPQDYSCAPQGAVKVLGLLLRAKGAVLVQLLRGQQFQGGADQGGGVGIWVFGRNGHNRLCRIALRVAQIHQG